MPMPILFYIPAPHSSCRHLAGVILCPAGQNRHNKLITNKIKYKNMAAGWEKKKNKKQWTNTNIPTPSPVRT